MAYKYTLIVMQCHYEYHCYIVKFDDNLLIKAKKMIEDVKNYKKVHNDYFGDVVYLDDGVIYQRYNYNSSETGDIYIINSNSINDLMHEVLKCNERAISYEKIFIENYSSKELSEIRSHLYDYHNFLDLQEIVGKHFELI